MPDQSPGRTLFGRWSNHVSAARGRPADTAALVDQGWINEGYAYQSAWEALAREQAATQKAFAELKHTAESLLGERERAMEADRHRIRADDLEAERDEKKARIDKALELIDEAEGKLEASESSGVIDRWRSEVARLTDQNKQLRAEFARGDKARRQALIRCERILSGEDEDAIERAARGLARYYDNCDESGADDWLGGAAVALAAAGQDTREETNDDPAWPEVSEDLYREVPDDGE